MRSWTEFAGGGLNPGATVNVTGATNSVGNTTRSLQVHAAKKGDMNCDGAVNFADISPFVALIGT